VPRFESRTLDDRQIRRYVGPVEQDDFKPSSLGSRVVIAILDVGYKVVLISFFYLVFSAIFRQLGLL